MQPAKAYQRSVRFTPGARVVCLTLSIDPFIGTLGQLCPTPHGLAVAA
jgi:hypothetical protein